MRIMAGKTLHLAAGVLGCVRQIQWQFTGHRFSCSKLYTGRMGVLSDALRLDAALFGVACQTHLGGRIFPIKSIGPKFRAGSAMGQVTGAAGSGFGRTLLLYIFDVRKRQPQIVFAVDQAFFVLVTDSA